MILVTGATGFIGRSLVQALERDGRLYRVYSGRINNPLAIRTALVDVETVIHLAGAENRGRVHLLEHVDVEGTQRLLEECERAEIGRLIFVSRLNADPNSWYPLLRTKGEVERLIRSSEIPHTILRTATLFGRDDRFLNVIAALAYWSWPFVWLPNGGGVAMQPLWVEDFVRCLAAAVDRPDLVGETIELAGAERLHYYEIVYHILDTTGMRRILIRPSVKLFRRMMIILSRFWRRPPVNRFFLDRFSVPEVAALDSVLRHFDFHPAHMNQQSAYLRRLGLKQKLFRFDSE
ncbi:MAG: NAD(P)H-binding protein [Candidatus Promineifilaceae bacterium]